MCMKLSDGRNRGKNEIFIFYSWQMIKFTIHTFPCLVSNIISIVIYTFLWNPKRALKRPPRKWAQGHLPSHWVLGDLFLCLLASLCARRHLTQIGEMISEMMTVSGYRVQVGTCGGNWLMSGWKAMLNLCFEDGMNRQILKYILERETDMTS